MTNDIISPPSHLCDYGCNQEAKYQFKNGKWCCENFYSKCPNKRIETSKKSKGRIGYWTGKNRYFSQEWREKISKSCKGPCPSKGRPGRKKSIEFKLIMSNKMRGDNNPAKRQDVKNKISNTVKNLWNDPNSVYYTKDYWDKRYKGELTSPNKSEIFMTKILNTLFPNKYQFVGNGKVWISKVNPDWIHKDNKKVIEFFGEWWHGEEFRKTKLNDNLSNKEHEELRIKHYMNNDYKCLIIWEYELKNLKKLVKKIINFEKENDNAG